MTTEGCQKYHKACADTSDTSFGFACADSRYQEPEYVVSCKLTQDTSNHPQNQRTESSKSAIPCDFLASWSHLGPSLQSLKKEMRSASRNPLLLSSTTSPASSSVLTTAFGSGRIAQDEDQHLEMRFQTSSDSHILGPSGRAGRAQVTVPPVVTRLAPAKVRFPVST